MNVKFYLDKADKSKQSPIHLFLRQKGVNIKVSTGEKICRDDWDNENQRVKNSEPLHNHLNDYLKFLQSQVERYIETTPHQQLTEKRVKLKITELVEARKKNSKTNIIPGENDYYKDKQMVTLVDLFAGAGGFSEGFLQAESGNKLYDFLLGSDINENCELTHLARYNYQLGMDAEFLRQDITEPDFLDNLLKKIAGRTVDVVCGGPPCQSFSLAGKRKKFDKKDDLFAHYLKVIRRLRPKYFVMENVKGILTKEGGKVQEMIIKEIRSIIDLNEFQKLLDFVKELRKVQKEESFVIECYDLRLQFEAATDKKLDELRERYLLNIDSTFRSLTPKIVDYKTSKTDKDIITIRHGINLLKRTNELAYIRKKVINEKAFSDIDDDFFAEDFDAFLTSIDPDTIVDKINRSFQRLKPGKAYAQSIAEIIKALEIYTYSFDECMHGMEKFAKSAGLKEKFDEILDQIRLYKIKKPFVALASDYGVPQNRERVLFIGCRKDQELITDIPATVKGNEKVTVFEALYDLDFIDNDDEKFSYEKIDLAKKYNGSYKKFKDLLKKRSIDGKIESNSGMTYADWSRKGRLNGRFRNAKSPFYVKTQGELDIDQSHIIAPLHNHKTSKQNDDVVNRLEIILKAGDYDDAKKELKDSGLDSQKRNYNVLVPDSQSPTVLTLPDDYIHFSTPRALTVREMARLQSFDDSFVFQGKRSTGGNKRKMEVPQFTLVGNAVPPLMARAVAIEILKKID